MTKKIERSQATLTEFGSHLSPQLHVKPKESFKIETMDNFFGEINTEEDLPTPEQLPFLRHQYWKVNPVAGPIYIDGLKKGDVLVLEIEDIIPDEQGWTGFTPGFGNLADHYDYPEFQQPYSRIIKHRPGKSGTTSDGTGTFNVTRDVTFPLHPFIGTIATAPERGIENTLVSQGPWGGNIDIRDICKGTKIMMNTYHNGGLLFLGDGHGSQGDSEYTGLANETALDITANCDIIPQKTIPGILRMEKADSIVQVDSARNAGSMDKALNSAFIGMMQWLTEEFGMDSKEAYLHFTANPELRINTYQFVGPSMYVVGVEFPKKYL